MDFKPSEVQALTRGMVREFSEKEVNPAPRRPTRSRCSRRDPREDGQLQILGLLAPADAGGAGVDTVTYAIVIEELARACASTAFVVEAHNSQCIFPIAAFGSDDQKGRFLPSCPPAEARDARGPRERGRADLGSLNTTASPTATASG